ncbi:P-loop containing nucleoside triphosphate hydrolase protein [Pisolithus albus]|nr:P-loop containing nucleoside triphosphate hydrolase protein [Pisolithus albus]
MGPTGAGKSSFIASITNDNGEGVGHDLTSCTSDIKATKLKFKRFSVVLVDTPGFNDTKKSDLEILNLISDWLNPNPISTPILSAILYFHRITDNRMAGTPLKNLRVFEKLCGKDAMSKVILVTTMWDEVDTDTGNERLEELKDSYWKGMISRGSTTFKCNGLSLDNVWSILKSRLPQWLKKEEEASVLLQKEISDMKLEIKETAAGQQLCSRLEELAQKRMETLGKIQEETKRADEKTAEDLWKEFNQIKDQLDSTLSQARQLKMNPATRWLRRSVGRK